MPDKSAKLTPIQLDRKIGLLKAGLSIADVAREAGVSRQTAWEVFKDKCTSRRVQEVFARVIGQPVEELFPEAAA
ncbi:MAG: Winged helix-turn-helix DNA-binding [Gemmatimonadetes bacterium]|nr:Winged helix-turn-helix DNA-binding [Gemmatimonadota bacterium]